MGEDSLRDLCTRDIIIKVPSPVLSASLINFVSRYLSVSTRATVGKNRIKEIFFKYEPKTGEVRALTCYDR